MRNIFIDLSNDTTYSSPTIFGGIKGEHNESQIVVTLPSRMISDNISYYYFKFETESGEAITSPQIIKSALVNSTISVKLWSQLTHSNILICNVIAESLVNNTVEIKGKSPTFKLMFKESATGVDVTYDPTGNEEALQKAINEALTEAKNNGFMKGNTGASAYEIAVEQGFEGTEEEWLESLKPTIDDKFSLESKNPVQNKVIAAALVEKVNQSELDNINKQFGYNLIDGYILSNGNHENIMSSIVRKHTDYIMCTGGVTLSYIGEFGNGAVNAISFYDKEKIFISGSKEGAENTPSEITTPENARYFRISFVDDNFYLDFNSSLIDSVLIDLQKEFDDSKNENYEITNYVLLTTTLEKKSFNKNTQKLVVDNNCNTLSYVKLDQTRGLYCNSTETTYVYFFDKDLNYLGVENLYIGHDIAPSSYPDNAEYFMLTYDTRYVGASRTFWVAPKPNTFCLYVGSSILKIKGIRPRIDIYLTDTEETIFKKLVDAYITEDCDVYWEHGTYNFDSIYGLMKTRYKWNTAYELPLGGNCRYYFNGSTINGTYTGAESIYNDTSVLGSHRNSGNYELYDGIIVGTDIGYCVHDEAQASTIPYIRKYSNIKMQTITGSHTNYISKCIGGGTGRYGEVVIENCQFYMDENSPTMSMYQEVSYHGVSTADESDFRLSIYGSYFQHGIGLHSLGTNQIGKCILANNKLLSLPNANDWELFDYGNEYNVPYVINLPYSSNITIPVNKLVHIATLEGAITIALGEYIEGLENEWVFTIKQGETTQEINLPEIVWDRNFAPVFDPNSKTEIRLYYDENILRGVWL